MQRTLRHVQDIYPLAPLQHFFLQYELLLGNRAACLQQLSYRLRGRLASECLKRAWEAVVARHDVLRTAFRWRKLPQPLQIVVRSVELPWHEADLRGHLPEEQTRRIAHYADMDLARGQDVRQAPLLRFALFRLTDDEFHLVWTCNHLILDAWSAALLIAELSVLYEAERCGAVPRLPTRRPFRDYIALLMNRPAAAAEARWVKRLEGVGPDTLGGIAPRARQVTDETGGGSAIPVELSLADTAGLRELARRSKVTVATLLYAAWALVLARHAGRDEAIFGITSSGRPDALAGASSMVGVFSNTLPLRVPVPAERPVGTWLQDIAGWVADVRAHDHVPLPRLCELGGLPEGGRLFDSVVSFQNQDRGVDDRLAEASSLVQVEPAGVRYASMVDPIALTIEPGDPLRGILRYQRRRFERATMEGVVADLQSTLTELSRGAPDLPLVLSAAPPGRAASSPR